MGSNDHIQIRNPIQKSVPLLLGNASSHSNNHSPLLLQPFIPSQSAIDLMFRFLPDAAGVDEDEIGLFGVLSFQGNGTPPRDEASAPCRARSSDSHRFRYRLASARIDLAYYRMYLQLMWRLHPGTEMPNVKVQMSNQIQSQNVKSLI